MKQAQTIIGVIWATIVAIGIYKPVTIIGWIQTESGKRNGRPKVIRLIFESDNETALDLCANGAVMVEQNN